MGARVGWGVGLPAKYVGASEGLGDEANLTGTVGDALGEDVGLSEGAIVSAGDGAGVGLSGT